MNEKILVTKSSMPPYEEYIEAIKPLWDTHWLTNMGKYHRELEVKLRDFLDVPYLSLMVNGHMSLELTIQAFDFPEGSEVITTPFTFISTTHAIVRNHLTPIFCDVKEIDGTIDETKIEKLITDKTVAILPVHVYGHVCNVEEIQRIADRYNLKVIYDAAHAFGIKYKDKGIGSFGNASVFSFHATKVFNTIEGGAVTFSDPKLYDKLYNLKNFGIRGEEIVSAVGANAKMNEFCAIMGLCNLRHIGAAIEKRRQCVAYYTEKLIGIEGIELFVESKNASNNCAYYPILVKDNFRMSRDDLYDLLKLHNIYTRKYFYPVTSNHECYKKKYQNIEIPKAEKLSNEVLTLPLFEDLNREDINYIISIIANGGTK